MSETLYLYGAAVQGIQEFIYRTNKLREIVGASELVAMICTELFADVLYNKERDSLSKLEKDICAIVNAAGNIKYIFESKEECQRVARIFPKTVMEFAPGVTLSQSVVELNSENDFGNAVKKLEQNLRAQRNRPMREQNIGLTGILRSRTTGFPVSHIRQVKNNENEYLDSATYHKLYDIKTGKRKETFKLLCRKAFGNNIELQSEIDYKRLPLDIKDITSTNDWIAIIHADGNGLGQVVQKIGNDREKFRDFSRLLDEATVEAARNAFYDTVLKNLKQDEVVPARPIVLSGDDLTVICRADLAIPFTESFLKYFEEFTKNKLGNLLLGKNKDGSKSEAIFKSKENQANHLTACAGIAFIKSSFPFHFGYKLAESLCDRAKKDTKELFNAEEGYLPASCIMFHKVQDSFITDFNEISVRELQPQSDLSFEYGPYYLNTLESSEPCEKYKNEKRWTINTLQSNVKKLNDIEGNVVKSSLRNWITLLSDDPAKAKQKLNRIIEILEMRKRDSLKDLVEKVTLYRDDNSDVREKGIMENGEVTKTVKVFPVYDLLTIHTINNQITR